MKIDFCFKFVMFLESVAFGFNFFIQEWAAKQSSLKEEEIEITFSYWDGSGHRKTLRMKKGKNLQSFYKKILVVVIGIILYYSSIKNQTRTIVSSGVN